MAKQNKKTQNQATIKNAHQPQYKPENAIELDIDYLKKITISVLLLFFIATIPYIPALFGGYVWDDESVLRDNLLLRTPDGLAKIWFHPSLNSKEQHYWPLVYTTFWLEYHIWGQNLFGYHLVNVLLHAANAILLWILLRRLFIPGAWIAAALFAVHPVHVESVAWIVERKDVLSGIFYLLSLFFFLNYRDRKDWKFYALSLFLFVCALLSKSIATTLPIAILIIFWWKEGRITKQDFKIVLPYFAIAVVVGLADVHFSRSLEPIKAHFPILKKILISNMAFWFYISKLVFPTHLMAIYPLWKVDPPALWQLIFPLLTIILFVILFLTQKRLGRGPLAGFLYFTFTIAPVLGFIIFTYLSISYVADRFQYLASIGLITLFAAGIAKLGERMNKEWLMSGVVALLILILGIISWKQSGTYKDIETLFSHNIKYNPGSHVVQSYYGYSLFSKGKLDEAIPHLKEALRLNNDDPSAQTNLGYALFQKGDLDGAIVHFREALRIDPTRANVISNLGYALFLKGNYDESITFYRQALKLDPYYIVGYNNLGLALVQKGNIEEAKKQYLEAIRINPDYAMTYINLGDTFINEGNLDEAIANYQKAVELDSNIPTFHNKLGAALDQKGKYDEATYQFNQTLYIDPNDVYVYNGLGTLAFHQKKYNEAINNYSNALKLDPHSVEVYANLGMVFAKTGEFEAAINSLQRALQIRPESTEALNNLAWIYATSPDAKYRNAAEALRLANQSLKNSKDNPTTYDVLAAAYAENGDFNNALQTAQKALETAHSKHNDTLAAEIEKRLELYKTKKPFRDIIENK